MRYASGESSGLRRLRSGSAAPIARGLETLPQPASRTERGTSLPPQRCLGERLRVELLRAGRRVLGDARAAPLPDELPEPLRPLLRRQAVELSDERWDYDVDRLATVLEEALAGEAEAAGAPGPATRLRRRARRLRARGRRLAARYPRRAGFLAGALTAVGIVAILLAATGYFSAPLLKVTAFEYHAPDPGTSRAHCEVRVESDYVIKDVYFTVDGDEVHTLDHQKDPPWNCGNQGRNTWNTCFTHADNRAQHVDPGRPHTLTAVVTDKDDNVVRRARRVRTSCSR
jgi:hypothetical protein